jgi:hypothetical protein
MIAADSRRIGGCERDDVVHAIAMMLVLRAQQRGLEQPLIPG